MLLCVDTIEKSKYTIGNRRELFIKKVKKVKRRRLL